MEDFNNKSNNLPVLLQNTSLVRVNKSIDITNRLLFKGIEELFNKAYAIINKNEEYREGTNFCHLMEYDTKFWENEVPKYFFLTCIEGPVLKWTHITEEDYENANKLLSESINKNPFHCNSYLYRGIGYVILKNYTAADLDFNMAIKLNPTSVHALLRKGILYILMDKGRIAAEIFTEAIRLAPSWNTYYYRAILGYESSIEDYTSAIEYCPNNETLYIGRGDQIQRSFTYEDGVYEKSIADYKSAIQINPYLPESYERLAAIYYYELEDYNNAILIMDQAIRLIHSNWSLHATRGYAKLLSGDYKGAVSDYTISIRLNPENENLLVKRASAKIKLGDIEGGKKDIESSCLNINWKDFL